MPIKYLILIQIKEKLSRICEKVRSMHKNTSIIILVSVILAFMPAATDAMGLVKSDASVPEVQINNESYPNEQNNSTAAPDQSYSIAMGMVWSQYSEDIKYLNDVLNDYVTKNITSREALQSTTSIYILTSDTLNTVAQLKPPEEEAKDYSNALNAVAYLKFSVWNLAKFFETNNTLYSKMAREDYNMSAGFYSKKAQI
jgi:hypothetical protein